MSFLAKLFLDSTEIPLLSANLSINQNTDGTGRPSANPNGGFINIRVLSTYENLLYEWMVNNNLTKNGYIRFFHRDGMRRQVDWQFADCFCVQYEEVYSDTGQNPMSIQLTLSPGVLKINQTVFNKGWGVTELGSQSGETISFIGSNPDDDANEEQEEAQNDEESFVDMKIFDSMGNVIEEITDEGEFIIQIETKGKVGKTITIDLNSNKFDYIYNDSILKDDKLSDYMINNNTEKIQIEAIIQKDNK